MHIVIIGERKFQEKAFLNLFLWFFMEVFQQGVLDLVFSKSVKSYEDIQFVHTIFSFLHPSAFYNYKLALRSWCVQYLTSNGIVAILMVSLFPKLITESN